MKNNKNSGFSRTNITRRQQFLVTGTLVAILAGLFGVFALVGYALDRPAVSSYETCIEATGSVLQESYPEVCVTKDGARFQNPAQLAPRP